MQELEDINSCLVAIKLKSTFIGHCCPCPQGYVTFLLGKPLVVKHCKPASIRQVYKRPLPAFSGLNWGVRHFIRELNTLKNSALVIHRYSLPVVSQGKCGLWARLFSDEVDDVSYWPCSPWWMILLHGRLATKGETIVWNLSLKLCDFSHLKHESI